MTVSFSNGVSLGNVVTAVTDSVTGGVTGLSAGGQTLPVVPAAYTWAGKPDATAVAAGTVIRITDIGTTAFGTLWESDGLVWSPLNNRALLYNNAIPVGIAQSGTVAADGTITFGVALPGNYPNGIWLYFPAGAITTPAAGAAFYYCTSVGGSTTNFRVTQATPIVAPFQVAPTIPVAPAAAVGSGGAYTAPTTIIEALRYAVKGGVMGLNGTLKYLVRTSHNNSGNNKTGTVKFSSASIYTNTTTTQLGSGMMASISNRGSAGQQVFTNGAADSAFNSGNSYTAQDTSVNQNFSLSLTLATATDYIIAESLSLALES